MYPNLAESPIWRVSEGVYRCVPLTIGPLGIHWNVSTHPDGFTSYAAALEKDLRVSAFDNALNMISTAACAVGLDPATLSREDLGGPVRDWLMQARPQIKVISGSLGDQLTVLLNKEVDLQLVGFPWNVLQARTQGVDIGFAIPTEGSYGYVELDRGVGDGTEPLQRDRILQCRDHAGDGSAAERLARGSRRDAGDQRRAQFGDARAVSRRHPDRTSSTC